MAVLIYGADFIIDEGEKIANHFHISPFIIGATLIALGTSLPEMAVSISASYKGSADIAVANVIGSTIFNISLVLGVTFVIAKNISPSRDLFGHDSSWVLFPIFVFMLMGFDGVLNTIDGILFLMLMVAYVMFLINSHRLESENKIKKDQENFKWFSAILFLLLGFVALVGGANQAVISAKNIATDFGVNEWIIGLFLVAFGTSLPELVVAIKASLKNRADMAIGTIIGSNVANFTMVLGISAIVNPLNVDFATYMFDIVTAVLLSFMLVFVMANKLYNKSVGLVFLVVLILVMQNSLSQL